MSSQPFCALQWRYNESDGVWNHQPCGCLSNRLFRHRSKKTSKLRVTGLCVGNYPVNFPHKGPVARKIFSFDDVIMVYDIRVNTFPSGKADAQWWPNEPSTPPESANCTKPIVGPQNPLSSRSLLFVVTWSRVKMRGIVLDDDELKKQIDRKIYKERVYLVKYTYVSLWEMLLFCPVDSSYPFIGHGWSTSRKNASFRILLFLIQKVNYICSFTTSLHTYWHCTYLHYSLYTILRLMLVCVKTTSGPF